MTRCRTCDLPTPSIGKRTRCADCLREHRDTAHVRSKRRRVARRDAICERLVTASLPALRRLIARRSE